MEATNKIRKIVKLAAINMSEKGSTGTIMLHTAQSVRDTGGEALTFSTQPSGKKRYKRTYINEYHTYYGSYFENNLHYVLGYYTGKYGCFSSFATRRLIQKLKKFGPTVIHLHNLHSAYLNLEMLFSYIRKNNIPVVWTFHDCWAFTGKCPHYMIAKCAKWKTGCYECPQYQAFPVAKVDATAFMWKKKKKWTSDIRNFTIVTPSAWLASQVKESFLKEYPVQVINNGIDLSIFKPRKSGFLQKYGITDQYTVLGVAMYWDYCKGIDVFVELSERLGKRFKIVLVGTDSEIDAKLPDNIISIHRTESPIQLAEIYSAADVFANPTREEVLGLVNIEALACGTPVITFDTGGSPECIDHSCGCVVDREDIDAMEKKIRWVCEQRPFSTEACVQHAKGFDKELKYLEYVDLYEELGNKVGKSE